MSQMTEPVRSHSMNQPPKHPWASRTEVLGLITVVFSFLLLVHIANSLESDAPFAQLVIMIFRLFVMVMQVVSVVGLLRERTAEAKAKDSAASQPSSSIGE